MLHALDPRVKQAWLVALLLLPGKLALPGKAAVCLSVAAVTAASLPRRVWAQQLLTLGALCCVLFLFSALSADRCVSRLRAVAVMFDPSLFLVAVSVAPLTQLRMPGPGVDASLPQLAQAVLGSRYSYVLLHLGPLHVTRRGAAFAASAACLTFTLLQSARLVLSTTPPEGLAAGLAWAARPLRMVAPLRQGVDEAILGLLLALRFCSLVFEEARNLALALATRGVDWAAMGPLGSLETGLALLARLMGALFANAAQIADAMRARGFQDAAQARAALQVRDTPLLRLMCQRPDSCIMWSPSTANCCICAPSRTGSRSPC